MNANRSGIIVMGVAIAIFGWAVMVNALSNLSPAFAGGPVGILQSMTPGFVPGGQSTQPPPTQQGSGPAPDPNAEGGRGPKGRGRGTGAPGNQRRK